MTYQEENRAKLINRCQRISKLVELNAADTLIENEVRKLNEFANSYKQLPVGQTNGEVYEKGSDDEHYEYVDYCLANGHIDMNHWRKLSI
jgi:hypothetical protein